MPTVMDKPTAIRIPLQPTAMAGCFDALTDLRIRRPGDLRATIHSVTYWDETGEVRRGFGEDPLPGPHAILVPRRYMVSDDTASTRAHEGDEILLGDHRFIVDFDETGEVALVHLDGPTTLDVTPTRGAPLEITRSTHLGDLHSQIISATASGLILVGHLGATSTRVEPFTIDTPQLVLPSEARPAVALRVRTVEDEPVLSLVPVHWSEPDAAYKVASRYTTFGGNYAAWHDPRTGAYIARLTGHHFYGAIAVHDLYPTT